MPTTDRTNEEKLRLVRRLRAGFSAAKEPLPAARGCSSDGRALQSHCRGQGFDSPQLHQPPALEFLWSGGRRRWRGRHAGGRHSPYGIACIVGDEEAAAPVDPNIDGSSMGLAPGCQEASQHIARHSGRATSPERDEDDLVAGAS